MGRTPSWVMEVEGIVNRHVELVKKTAPLLVESIDLVREELRVRETPSLNRVDINLREIAKSLTGSVTMEVT